MSETNTVPDKKLAGMDLKLDASVRLIEPKNNLLTVASVTIEDCFVVKGVKIVAGEKGLFVDMPSTQDSNGNYRDIAHPITGAFRERLNSVIMDGYNDALAKNHDIGKAQREFSDKLPIATGWRLARQRLPHTTPQSLLPICLAGREPKFPNKAVNYTERIITLKTRQKTRTLISKHFR